MDAEGKFFNNDDNIRLFQVRLSLLYSLLKAGSQVSNLDKHFEILGTPINRVISQIVKDKLLIKQGNIFRWKAMPPTLETAKMLIEAYNQQQNSDQYLPAREQSEELQDPAEQVNANADENISINQVEKPAIPAESITHNEATGEKIIENYKKTKPMNKHSNRKRTFEDNEPRHAALLSFLEKLYTQIEKEHQSIQLIDELIPDELKGMKNALCICIRKELLQKESLKAPFTWKAGAPDLAMANLIIKRYYELIDRYTQKYKGKENSKPEKPVKAAKPEKHSREKKAAKINEKNAPEAGEIKLNQAEIKTKASNSPPEKSEVEKKLEKNAWHLTADEIDNIVRYDLYDYRGTFKFKKPGFFAFLRDLKFRKKEGLSPLDQIEKDNKEFWTFRLFEQAIKDEAKNSELFRDKLTIEYAIRLNELARKYGITDEQLREFCKDIIDVKSKPIAL